MWGCCVLRSAPPCFLCQFFSPRPTLHPCERLWEWLGIPRVSLPKNQQSSGSGPLASNNVGYAFGDVGATPLQPTIWPCCGVGLAPCLLLFHNLLALGSLLCFQTKQTWLKFSSSSKKKECGDSQKLLRVLNSFFYYIFNCLRQGLLIRGYMLATCAIAP